jgi:hypothetical protein
LVSRLVYRLTALVTELDAGGKLGAAAGALERKVDAALETEPRLWGVVVLAPGTLHTGPSGERGGSRIDHGAHEPSTFSWHV